LEPTCGGSGIQKDKRTARRPSKSKKKTFGPSTSHEKIKKITPLLDLPNIAINTDEDAIIANSHIVEDGQIPSYINKKSEEVSNSNDQINSSSAALTNSFQLPLTSTSQLPRSTLYPLKDSNDPGLPSFCISAGAEQIGFDVISAYINNLN